MTDSLNDVPTDTTDLLVTVEQGVMHLCFHRPQQKNAINVAMYRAMVHALQQAAERPDIKLVAFSGSGGNFTSGNDLADFATQPPTDSNHPVVQFLQTMATFEKPVVAAVEGVAVGIGTTLLLHCDYVVATEDARLQLPFANLGLCPEFAASYLLPKVVGYAKASEWLLFGEFFTGQDAASAGLVNRAVATGEFRPWFDQICQRLCEQPPHALKNTKRLLKSSDKTGMLQAMEDELVTFQRSLGSSEFAEAVSAFFEKRKPNFDKL